MARTGCLWRALPHDFAVRCRRLTSTFLRWCRTGIWRKILRALREEARRRSGRRSKPTAAVIDSSSVKGTPVRGVRGFDGAKKIDGIKRHIAVDTSGLLLAAHVTPANVQDRAAFPALIRKTTRACATVEHVWLDGGYTGPTVADAAQRHGVTTTTIIGGPKAPSGGVPGPATLLGRGTHQRLDQSQPPTRPPIREHHRRTRRTPRPQPDRSTAPPTRPRPVVRHALGSGARRPLSRRGARSAGV